MCSAFCRGVGFSSQSRSQRPRSFWLATGIATSGQVQLRIPRFTDFPSLCVCSESSLTNLIGSGLNLLCLHSHSKPECRWACPGVPIFPAHDKRNPWGRGWAFNRWIRGFFPKIQLYSADRMDEPLQLANSTTTESLLELGSVLDASLND